MQAQKTFEFGDWFPVAHRSLLQADLESLWGDYQDLLKENDDVEDAAQRYQGFLNFDGGTARSRNFVGFIQQDEWQLEIYPKVFRDQVLSDEHCRLIMRHLFWWLDFSTKWRFPFNHVGLEENTCTSLPELLIYLIARQFYEVLSAQPLLSYQEEEASMSVPRGRINFERYLSRNLSRGMGHVLEVDHEPLMYDHVLNRGLKYAARLLQGRAGLPQTQRLLHDVLFLLDEVTDERCTSQQLDRIRLNAAYDSYWPVIASCKWVLDQQLYSHRRHDQAQWSLLLPMEVVFEEFIGGFLQKEFSSTWKVEKQRGGLSLVEAPTPAFRMRHDVLLSRIGPGEPQRIIIDTKYKLRPGDLKADVNKGIAQADMYQMTAYALRRGCRQVLLLYPNLTDTCRPADHFFVDSALDGERIHIIAAEVPFWSMQDMDQLGNRLKTHLTALFELF